MNRIPVRTELTVINTSDRREEAEERKRVIIATFKDFPNIKCVHADKERYHLNYTKISFEFTINGKMKLSYTGRGRITPEEILELEEVPKWAKRFVAYHLDAFTKSIGWYVQENIGIGIVNTKGLAKLNVTKT